MKNIHILPTDKPSRLFKFANELHLDTIPKDYYKKYNIYITSNEEIKEGDWFYNIISLKPEPFKACENGNGYVNCNKYSHNRIDCKKIILTTDQDLIKNGVQAIDDEFLEWFVKNPSCERVSIEEEDYSQKCRECGETVKRGYNCAKGCFMKSGNFIPTDKNINYKIIIPQEEPKPHSFCETPDEKCTMNYCDENGCLNRKRELVEVDENKKNLYFKKQVMNPYPVEGYSYTAYEKGFREGYEESNKWQQEQDKNKYSEEEVLDLLYKRDLYLLNRYEEIELELPEDWFEQFKNK
jgi:hypothetical protein